MVQRSGTPLAGRSIVVGSERGGRGSEVGRVGGARRGWNDFATLGREMPALRGLGEAVDLMSVSSVTMRAHGAYRVYNILICYESL